MYFIASGGSASSWLLISAWCFQFIFAAFLSRFGGFSIALFFSAATDHCKTQFLLSALSQAGPTFPWFCLSSWSPPTISFLETFASFLFFSYSGSTRSSQYFCEKSASYFLCCRPLSLFFCFSLQLCSLISSSNLSKYCDSAHWCCPWRLKETESYGKLS